MLQLQLNDENDFMKKLLTTDLMNTYLVCRAEITTGYKLIIDGQLYYDFYDSKELEVINKRKYELWKNLKDIISQNIKGKKKPLQILITFLVDRTRHPELFSDDVLNHTINLKYDASGLYITLLTSLSGFSLDKQKENNLIEYFKNFLKNNEITTKN